MYSCSLARYWLQLLSGCYSNHADAMQTHLFLMQAHVGLLVDQFVSCTACNRNNTQPGQAAAADQPVSRFVDLPVNS